MAKFRDFNRSTPFVPARLRPLSARAALAGVALALVATAGSGLGASAQSAPFCGPGQQPQFVLGFADLHARLGATMGTPVECEHVDAASGDTQQHTTTGLAYFRQASGDLDFTNGWEHYALIGGQLLLWRNPSVDPPQATADEQAYVQDTLPLRSRVDQIDQDLTNVLQQAQNGNLGDVDFGLLGTELDVLQMLDNEFAASDPPAPLGAFAAAWLQGTQADTDAGQALLQARLDVEQPDVVAADLANAAQDLNRRDQLRAAAQYAFTEVLPVVVQ